jgi:hypothetical protein
MMSEAQFSIITASLHPFTLLDTYPAKSCTLLHSKMLGDTLEGFYNPFLGSDRFFSSVILYTVGMTPWMGDQPLIMPLPTTQTHNKCTQASMPRVRFEPMAPVFERLKTVHASGRAVTLTDAMYR